MCVCIYRYIGECVPCVAVTPRPRVCVRISACIYSMYACAHVFRKDLNAWQQLLLQIYVYAYMYICICVRVHKYFGSQ